MKNYLSIIALLLFLSTNLIAQDKLIFVIRVDDIMSRNTTILPRSIKPFEDVVENHGGKITWLVIPHRLIENANQDGKLKNELIESAKKGNEIAQHGYNHICQLCGQSSHEMYCSTNHRGFSYSQQKDLVEEGKKILLDSLGVVPTTFVSPGHVEDTTTYHVLRDEGFKYVSTTQPTKTFVYDNLFNLAPQNEFTWALLPGDYETQLHNALSDIKTKGKADGYYCIYFHDYFIRAGYEDSLVLKWTSELLDSVKSFYGSRLEFMTIGQAAQYFENKVTSTKEHLIHSQLSFSLSQNYPNPFNPTTTISYAIPHESNIKIDVYNSLGEKVKELVNGFLPAGNHYVTFNGSNLSSGVYYYSMSSGNFREVKKFILMK